MLLLGLFALLVLASAQPDPKLLFRVLEKADKLAAFFLIGSALLATLLAITLDQELVVGILTRRSLVVGNVNSIEILGLNDRADQLTTWSRKDICRPGKVDHTTPSMDANLGLVFPFTPRLVPVRELVADILSTGLAESQAVGTDAGIHPFSTGKLRLEVVLPAIGPTLASLGTEESEEAEGTWNVDGTTADLIHDDAQGLLLVVVAPAGQGVTTNGGSDDDIGLVAGRRRCESGQCIEEEDMQLVR